MTTTNNTLIIFDDSLCQLGSVFEGFYGTILDSDFDYYFDSLKFALRGELAIVHNYWTHLYDSDKYKDLVRQEIFNCEILPIVCNELSSEYDLGIESIIAGSIYSPREYNFGNDKLTDVTYTFNCSAAELVAKFNNIISNNPGEYINHIKTSFGSRDGFISLTDCSTEDWQDRFQNYVNKSDDVEYITMFIDWLISRLDLGLDEKKMELISNISPLDCMISDDELKENNLLEIKENFIKLYNELD